MFGNKDKVEKIIEKYLNLNLDIKNINKTKINYYDKRHFYKIIDTALKNEEHPFKDNLLILKNHIEDLNLNDSIKIIVQAYSVSKGDILNQHLAPARQRVREDGVAIKTIDCHTFTYVVPKEDFEHIKKASDFRKEQIDYDNKNKDKNLLNSVIDFLSRKKKKQVEKAKVVLK